MTKKKSFAGQKVYSNLLLKFYNFVVLFFNNNFAWRCKTSKLLELFKNNVSPNHLDIGVGTGFYLKKVKSKLDKVTLMDLNENCLQYASKNLNEKNVSSYKQDILENVDKSFHKKFDSISCNYLVHCLPDNGSKETAFKNIAYMLKDNGIAFGSTIINDYDNNLAKKIAKKFNDKQIFDNNNDSLKRIENYLKNNFQEYSISQIGSVCIFKMSKPTRNT